MKIIFQFLIVIIVALVTIGILAEIYAEPAPEFFDGDIVLQTTASAQSSAIIAATGSVFTQVGIISKKSKSGLATVIEADSSGVREITLEDWIKKGVLHRYAVYHYHKLRKDQAEEILDKANSLKGRKYDYFYDMSNKEMYCSELAWTAYREAGIDIGKLQTMRSLNTDNIFVRNLVRMRWRSDPECMKAKTKTADECQQIVFDRDVITPVGIAADLNLELVYSNYPF